MAKNPARSKQSPAPAKAETAVPPQAATAAAQPQGQQGQIQVDPQFIMNSLQQQRDEANNKLVMASAHAEQLTAEVQRLNNVIAQLSTELTELKGESEEATKQ